MEYTYEINKFYSTGKVAYWYVVSLKPVGAKDVQNPAYYLHKDGKFYDVCGSHGFYESYRSAEIALAAFKVDHGLDDLLDNELFEI
jgi:hypothetical protein